MARPPQQSAIAVSLAVEPLPSMGLRATVTFRNATQETVSLWNRFLPADAILGGNWFRITTRDGQRLPYVGELAKWPAPTPRDFVPLGPGESRSVMMLIVHEYQLPPGAPVIVRFEAFNPSIGEQRLMPLASNEVQVRVP